MIRIQRSFGVNRQELKFARVVLCSLERIGGGGAWRMRKSLRSPGKRAHLSDYLNNICTCKAPKHADKST